MDTFKCVLMISRCLIKNSYTFPSGLLGVLRINNLVFELNAASNSAGSSTQSADDPTALFFYKGQIIYG